MGCNNPDEGGKKNDRVTGREKHMQSQLWRR